MEESAELIKSSGGVFEVEDKGILIYSKRALGRFPSDNEVVEIVRGIESGLSLTDAQNKAAEGLAKPISFFDWLGGLLQRSQSRR